MKQKPRYPALAAAAAGLVMAVSVPAQGLAAPAAELTPAAVDTYLTETIDTTGSPGISVVVTDGDQVVHAAGYGRDGHGDAMSADTPMRIASLSKAFTATAVMILADRSEISLDEPVADQLPGFAMDDPRADRITVRQLLDQTSGLSDTTVDIDAAEGSTDLAGYVASLRTGTLAADPGTHWEYCNVNFDLAARLVEVVDGRDIADFMRQEVFTPLGMDSTTLDDTGPIPAPGFNSLFGLWIPRDEIDTLRPDGSGGVVTTASDMGRWLIHQSGDGAPLLSPEAMTTLRTAGPLHDYALGWAVEKNPDGTDYLVHSGNLFTYNAAAAVIPDTGQGFAVMTNDAGISDVSYSVMTGLMALGDGETPEPIGPDRQVTELILGLVGLAAIGLAVLGVARSRRWAERRQGRPAWRIALRLTPLSVPIALFAAYPFLAEFLVGGRHVTWEQLTYFALPLTVVLGVAAICAAVTLTTRLARSRALWLAG